VSSVGGVDLVLVRMLRRLVGDEKVTLMSCFCRTCLRGLLREGWKGNWTCKG